MSKWNSILSIHKCTNVNKQLLIKSALELHVRQLVEKRLGRSARPHQLQMHFERFLNLNHFFLGLLLCLTTLWIKPYLRREKTQLESNSSAAINSKANHYALCSLNSTSFSEAIFLPKPIREWLQEKKSTQKRLPRGSGQAPKWSAREWWLKALTTTNLLPLFD